MKGGEQRSREKSKNIQRSLDIEKDGTRICVEISMNNTSVQMENRVHEWLNKLYEEIQQDI